MEAVWGIKLQNLGIQDLELLQQGLRGVMRVDRARPQDVASLPRAGVSTDSVPVQVNSGPSVVMVTFVPCAGRTAMPNGSPRKNSCPRIQT